MDMHIVQVRIVLQAMCRKAAATQATQDVARLAKWVAMHAPIQTHAPNVEITSTSAMAIVAMIVHLAVSNMDEMQSAETARLIN